MNFRADLAEAVMDSSKIVTRRLVSENPRSPYWRERCKYRVGQEVAVCPGRGKPAIGRATVVSVERMKLGRLSKAEARAEGFRDRTDFENAWTLINGTYAAYAVVWRIGLEAIES